MAADPVRTRKAHAATGRRPGLQAAFLFLVAAVASASVWFYVDRIFVAHQVTDAAQRARPRGNLSDLYPRWLGARELLLHRRNPYSDEITLEIQKGYYGRALDPAKPDDPKDQQGFAYPVYVVFLLAPLIGLPFHAVQIVFYWTLMAVTAAAIGLWLRVLRWRPPALAIATITVLLMGSVPAVQGLKLQQLSLLVAALLAGSAAFVSDGFLFLGGGLLALATIKPQLAGPMVAWLLVWAVSDWRARRSLVLGFGTMMALLLGGAEIVLPGWLRMFGEAVEKYHRYTQSQSVLDILVPWSFAGKFLAGLAILACARFLWSVRTRGESTREFGNAMALVMALTVLIVPMYAPYNQVLLLPPVLVLIRDRAFFLAGAPGKRLGYWAGGACLAWQWIAGLGLCAVFLLGSPGLAMAGWKWPFFATFAIPVAVFGLTMLSVSGGKNDELAS